MGSTRRMSNPGAAPRGPHWAWRRARRGRRQGTDPFVRHRSLLFTVAYEMLGTAFDAEEGAGDVAAVGGRRPHRRARSAGPPGPRLHQSGAGPSTDPATQMGDTVA
jgi:hypothetical protein